MAEEYWKEFGKYKAIFDLSPEAIVLLDKKGTFIEANDRLFEWLDYTRPEVIGKSLFEIPFFSNKSRILVLKNFGLRMLGKIVDSYELEFICKSGNIKIGEVRGAPIRDTKNRVVGDLVLVADVTERRRMANWYQALITASPEAITVTDQSGRITFASELAVKLHGFDRADEMVGMAAIELINVDDREKAVGYMQQMLKSGQVKDAEYKLVKKDGAVFLGEINVASIKNEHDQIVGYIATTKDVTDRRKTELQLNDRAVELEKLSQSQDESRRAMVNLLEDAREMENALRREKDRINMIIESMGEGLLVVDVNQNIELINPAAEELLGVSFEKIVGKPWSEVMTAYWEDGREIPTEDRSYHKVLKEKKTMTTELDDGHYYKSSTGRLFPIVSVTTYLSGMGVVKVFRDASIEKEAKRRVTGELEHEQAQSHTVLENMGEGVVLTDESGKVTYVNPVFERLTGFTGSEVRGTTFADFFKVFDLNDKPVAAELMSNVSAVSAHDQEIKVQLGTKDGGMIAVVINSAPISERGKFNGVVRVIHDYSEDLALQKQKDDFFSIASHELRTPLTVISGNLDTVLEGYGGSKLTDDDRSLLKDSEEAGERLIALVNNFLNVSRLDQGRIVVNLKLLDACDLIGRIVDEMKPLIESKGLTLNYECDKSVGKINVDENLLREILVNLIGNSFKFTQTGGIRIELFGRDDRMVIRLSDTGIGIAKDKQTLLFKRFQQAMERTLTREAGGTGLGLYISREFARRMGGDLQLVSSEPGIGSVFEITLLKA